MKSKSSIILVFFISISSSIVSQIIKKDDLKLKNFERRSLHGSISGSIVNPLYEGIPTINIKADYNLAVYEVQNAAMPANSKFSTTKVVIVRNISEAIVTFTNSPVDTFDYTITNLPINKKLILVWYNKNININENDIKAAEQNYIVRNTYFQNTRNIKWAADVEYQNNFVFTCTNATPDLKNIQISILKNIINIPK